MTMFVCASCYVQVTSNQNLDFKNIFVKRDLAVAVDDLKLLHKHTSYLI